MDLLVETQPVTPTALAVLLVTRDQAELICDRCDDADEPIVVTMKIVALKQTFVLCGPCTRELPKGYVKI